MQAAVTAGLRGHEVILCEQTGNWEACLNLPIMTV